MKTLKLLLLLGVGAGAGAIIVFNDRSPGGGTPGSAEVGTAEGPAVGTTGGGSGNHGVDRAVKVRTLAKRSPIGPRIWTAGGELVGPEQNGDWVRVSVATGTVSPFSTAHPVTRPVCQPWRLVGDQILVNLMEPGGWIPGFASIPADGSAPHRELGRFEHPTLRVLDSRETGGGVELLLSERLRTQETRIYLVTLPSGTPTRLPCVPDDHTLAAWSPDWKTFIARRARSGDEAFVFDASGTLVGTLPKPMAFGPLVFSPDGRRLAAPYTRDPDGGRRLAMVSMKEPGRMVTLHSGAGSYDNVAWSPDGRRLAVDITPSRRPEKDHLVELAIIDLP